MGLAQGEAAARFDGEVAVVDHGVGVVLEGGAGDVDAAADRVRDVQAQVAVTAAARDRVQVAAVGQGRTTPEQAVAAAGIAEGEHPVGVHPAVGPEGQLEVAGRYDQSLRFARPAQRQRVD